MCVIIIDHGYCWSVTLAVVRAKSERLLSVIAANTQFWPRHCIGPVSPDINPTFPSFPWAGPGLLLSQGSHQHSSRGGSAPNGTQETHTPWQFIPISDPLCRISSSLAAPGFIAPLLAQKWNQNEWDWGDLSTETRRRIKELIFWAKKKLLNILKYYGLKYF